MSGSEGTSKGRRQTSKKHGVRVWREGRLIFVRQSLSPRAKTSRKAASQSLKSATTRAVQREAATGATPAQIAIRLGISENAVAKHIAEIAKPRPTTLADGSNLNIPRKGERKRRAAPAKRTARTTDRGAQPKRKFTPKLSKKQRRGAPPPDPAKVETAKRKRLEEAERHAARLRAVPYGESELELLARKGELTAVIEKIDHLAHRKDDPYAWRDLALAYRNPALRKPVGHALGIVGPEKVLRTIRENPSDLWGTDIVTFLQWQIASRTPTGTRQRPLLPHERSGGVWWGD